MTFSERCKNLEVCGAWRHFACISALHMRFWYDLGISSRQQPVRLETNRETKRTSLRAHVLLYDQLNVSNDRNSRSPCSGMSTSAWLQEGDPLLQRASCNDNR